MNEKQSRDEEFASRGASPESVVGRLGPHPATALGLDLDADGDRDLGRWLIASVLLGGRTREARAIDAFRRLEKEGLCDPSPVARAGVAGVRPCLDAAEVPKAEAVAALLARVCTALVQAHEGSVDRLAAGADGLEELAHRLSRLGAGFGKAAVLRFLTPLRDRWTAAGDLPASAAVLAAGRDLGWIPLTQDEEGAPATLARNASAPSGVPMRDVESALDKLGRAACLRGRFERCPLGAQCPRHGIQTGVREEA